MSVQLKYQRLKISIEINIDKKCNFKCRIITSPKSRYATLAN